MPLEFGLTDQGLVVPRQEDFLAAIRDEFEALTGLSIDWDNDLVLGIITEIMAENLDKVAETLLAVHDSRDPAAATGVSLANLARISGLALKLATKSTVPLGVTFAGTIGTVIPQGSVVQGGGPAGISRWVTTEDVEIAASGLALNVPLEAEVAGAIVALGNETLLNGVGSITTIVTPVPGWDSVIQEFDATVGRDTERDDQLRVRRQQSFALGAAEGRPGLQQSLTALDYITDAIVIDNTDCAPRNVLGFPMPGNSYLAVVLPDNLSADQIAGVFQVLYDTTPVASTHAGTDATGTVTGLEGVAVPVGFNYAVEVQANIIATLTLETGYAIADASAALQVLVEQAITDLNIGQPLRLLQLYHLAWDVPGIADAKFLVNGFSNDLEPTVVQKITVGTWSVVQA